MNHRARKNTSGFTGVYPTKRVNGRMRFAASITKEGKTHSLGAFDTIAEAVAERQCAERKLFGEFSALER